MTIKLGLCFWFETKVSSFLCFVDLYVDFFSSKLKFLQNCSPSLRGKKAPPTYTNTMKPHPKSAFFLKPSTFLATHSRDLIKTLISLWSTPKFPRLNFLDRYILIIRLQFYLCPQSGNCPRMGPSLLHVRMTLQPSRVEKVRYKMCQIIGPEIITILKNTFKKYLHKHKNVIKGNLL